MFLYSLIFLEEIASSPWQHFTAPRKDDAFKIFRVAKDSMCFLFFSVETTLCFYLAYVVKLYVIDSSRQLLAMVRRSERQQRKIPSVTS